MTDVPAPGPETVYLEGYADLPTLRHPAAWYAERIRDRRRFAFVKRTHGFWDRLVALADQFPPFGELVAEAARRGTDDYPPWDLLERALRVDRATIHKLDLGRQYRGFWEDGYFVEVIRDLRNPPDTDEWIEAEALRGYTRAVDRPALHAPDRLREVLLALAPRRRPWHYALVFKDALVTGEFRAVVEALRERNVIALGPSHLAGLGEALALPRFRHVRIHETEAMRHRGAALRELRAALSPRDVRASQPLLVLQAGSLAWWLMARLFPDFPETSFLDLGRVLDVWFPAVADKQPWFRFEKRQMVDAMGLGPLYRA